MPCRPSAASTSFFISRDGKVLDKVLGLKSKSEIEDSIKRALGTGQVAQR